MQLLEKILPTNNPRFEINHIFIDGENMVATDTQILIVKKHNMGGDKDCLIVNPKAKYKSIAVDALYKGFSVKSENFKYPEYKRIVTTQSMIELSGDVDGLTLLQSICAEKGMMVNFVKYASFMKALSKIQFNRYFVSNKNLPITIANNDYTIVLMPVITQPL